MIHQRGLYSVRCNNEACKNGVDMSPTIYNNTVEMGYQASIQHIQGLGWVKRADLTFCPVCGSNRRGITLMKRG